MRRSRVFILAAAVLILGACAPVDEGYSTAFFAMDTVMELTVYGEHASEVAASAAEKVNHLDRLLSVTDPGSEIYAINSALGNPVEVSEETFDIITRSLAISRRTGGAVDITIYPVVRAWGFTTDETQVPPQSRLDELLELVDYRGISAESGLIAVPQGFMLDLGSVAKGYCGDVLAMLVKQAGVKSALLNLGGNIHTVGAKPDGSPWNIAVQDPLDSGKYIGVVAVEGKAVVTSGGYQRYFEQDGSLYWHIFDPETGKPAHSGIISVTVIGENGVLCDGLSTALFIMGREKALEHYSLYKDFEAVIITEDGVVTITPGLAGIFTLTDTSGSYSLEIYDGVGKK